MPDEPNTSESESAPACASKLFQITEDDLTTLEAMLPESMWFRPDLQTAREKIKWRRVIEIIKDVRWNYGPPLQCHRLEADDQTYES